MNSYMETSVDSQNKYQGIDSKYYSIKVSYKDFVETLIKKYPENPNLALAHSALGIGGESGELIDAIKRVAIYEKELDRENIIEELGDLNFFMTDIQNKFSISDEEIIEHNVKKLEKRYPKGYSDSAAQERADKILTIDNVNINSSYDPAAGDIP